MRFDGTGLMRCSFRKEGPMSINSPLIPPQSQEKSLVLTPLLFFLVGETLSSMLSRGLLNLGKGFNNGGVM